MINWESYEMSISVVAAIFFDQAPRWIRYQESRGYLVGVGSRTLAGDRSYTLVDVKRMAHSLLHYGVIDRKGFKNCIARVDSLSMPVYSRSKDR